MSGKYCVEWNYDSKMNIQNYNGTTTEQPRDKLVLDKENKN